MSPKDADDDLLLKMLDSLFHIVASLTHDTTVTRNILQDLFVNIWEKRRSLTIRKPIVNYLIKFPVEEAHPFFTRLRIRARYALDIPI